MKCFNEVTLIGYVGQDPEVRYFNDNGKASFSLAVTERWKDKEGNQNEKTTWIPIATWNKGLVSIVENYIHKGSPVFIKGKLSIRPYENDAGEKRNITEVIIDTINMLGDAKNSNGQTRPNTSSQTKNGGNGGYEEDVPF